MTDRLTEEHLQRLRERMALNVAETGHPFHHLTRNGAIIDGDPRIAPAYDYVAEYFWLAGIPTIIPKPWAHPKKTVKLVSDWYNTTAGKRWLKKQSTAQVVEAAPAQQRSLWT